MAYDNDDNDDEDRDGPMHLTGGPLLYMGATMWPSKPPNHRLSSYHFRAPTQINDTNLDIVMIKGTQQIIKRGYSVMLK